MSDKTVVLAIFDSEASADAAVVALKDSGLVPADAIGVLVLDGDGQLKVGKVGARSTGEGAGIGAVLFLLGPAGVGIGLVGGNILGFLHQKGLGLAESDRYRIAAELWGGRAGSACWHRRGTPPRFRRSWPIWAACPRSTRHPTRLCRTPGWLP
jgi:hypothetical protein